MTYGTLGRVEQQKGRGRGGSACIQNNTLCLVQATLCKKYHGAPYLTVGCVHWNAVLELPDASQTIVMFGCKTIGVIAPGSVSNATL